MKHNVKTEERQSIDDLVNQFLKKGGKVTKCQPQLPKENEVHADTRDKISKERKAWREENNVKDDNDE